jgi:hypothetical protein
MKGNEPMKISFFKYVYQNRFWGREIERAETFTNMDDAVASFKDCFKYHLGRKPTIRQVDKFMSFGVVTAKNGKLEYEFSLSFVK